MLQLHEFIQQRNHLIYITQDKDDLGKNIEDQGTMDTDINREQRRKTTVGDSHWIDTYSVR